MNLYGLYALGYKKCFFFIHREQITAKLVAIDIKFNSIPAFTPIHCSQKLPLRFTVWPAKSSIHKSVLTALYLIKKNTVEPEKCGTVKTTYRLKL